MAPEAFISVLKGRCRVSFHVGDKVIHSIHGLGEIVQIEGKIIHDQSVNCYVFQTDSLMAWIPIDDSNQHSLRLPSKPEEFIGLSAILTSPSHHLLEDRVLRREQLMTQMRDGQLKSICQVVHDLTQFKSTNKLNDQEKLMLEQATNSLLVEWAYSLDISPNQAHRAMAQLLGK
jgi:RNA polymerase-interacting CarD/CdnL/TRCF family regulator